MPAGRPPMSCRHGNGIAHRVDRDGRRAETDRSRNADRVGNRDDDMTEATR